MNSPAVSVISIFYNAERYFEEAIESVLHQGFEDYELILADDGSSDSSPQIAGTFVERFPDRIRYVAHPGGINRGMSATRNLGLRHARGRYVAFIDADDRWRPSKLRDQVEVATTYPELAMVCGAVNYWRSWSGEEDCVVPTGHRQDEVVLPPEASLALYPLGSAMAPCPSDMLFRRDAVEALRGFEEHFTGAKMMYEDQAFLAKLYLAHPVWFDSRVWLDYRQHADSCVAEVQRDGRYDEVRRYFLEWFERYSGEQASHPNVRAAIVDNLRACRHPRSELIRRLPARSKKFLSGIAARFVNKALSL